MATLFLELLDDGPVCCKRALELSLTLTVELSLNFSVPLALLGV